MNRQVIEDIKSRIEISIPTIKHFRRWNNQKDHIAQESFFSSPSVFYEFVDTDITSLGLNSRLIVFTVRFHILFNSLEYEDLSILDLKQTLHNKFQGYYTANFSPMQSINEDENKDHESLYEYIMDYSTSMVDVIENTTVFLSDISIELTTEYASTSGTSGQSFIEYIG